MAKTNYFITELGTRYKEADLNYRTGRLTQYEFNLELLEILTKLLSQLGSIEPYYTQFKDMAEEEWKLIGEKYGPAYRKPLKTRG